MSDPFELKPCPFCGSSRITVWNIRDGQQAVCKDCKATGAPAFNKPSDSAATRLEAGALWNRRVETVTPDMRMALGEKVLALAEKVLASNPARKPSYVIVSTEDESLVWCNAFGFVLEEDGEFTVFSEEERNVFCLPSGGEWRFYRMTEEVSLGA